MAAEVGGDSGGGKKGKTKKGRGKKATPRIDMTPMVDLGFLLLTFFVLTTTMATPKSMPVVMPEKDDVTQEDKPKIAASKVLILMLGDKDRIYYYQPVDGDEEVQAAGRRGRQAVKESISLNTTGYGTEGIRKVIFETRKKVDEKWGKKDEMIVLIKPMDVSTYKNFVDILDEMSITQQARYATVEASKEEIDLIEDYKKAEGLL